MLGQQAGAAVPDEGHPGSQADEHVRLRRRPQQVVPLREVHRTPTAGLHRGDGRGDGRAVVVPAISLRTHIAHVHGGMGSGEKTL